MLFFAAKLIEKPHFSTNSLLLRTLDWRFKPKLGQTMDPEHSQVHICNKNYQLYSGR